MVYCTILENKLTADIMKRALVILVICLCTWNYAAGQHSISELREMLPLTESYPICEFKNKANNNKDNNWRWGWMSNNDIEKLRAVRFLDIQGKIEDKNTKCWVIAGRRYRPIFNPQYQCPDIFSVQISIGYDMCREIFAVYKDNQLCDTIEVFVCGYSKNVKDNIITKQYVLYRKGILAIYELCPTTPDPIIFESLTKTDKITAQRKDVTYQLNVESGKFVKTSETTYHPQDYPISYWGTNGTEIWNGTETKIGTITY
ncbi:MAG: hypothetical protein J6K74_04405 [Marinifilaceae bacterium]|nr:hypothetical protein [Marinifilaceae bacterium]